MVVLNVQMWMPGASLPVVEGWSSTLGVRKRSLPTVMTLPSWGSYDFSMEDDSSVVYISSFHAVICAVVAVISSRLRASGQEKRTGMKERGQKTR